MLSWQNAVSDLLELVEPDSMAAQIDPGTPFINNPLVLLHQVQVFEESNRNRLQIVMRQALDRIKEGPVTGENRRCCWCPTLRTGIDRNCTGLDRSPFSQSVSRRREIILSHVP